MSLQLKVLSFKNQPISAIDAVSIGNDGGSIGRSDDNTLVLPDTEKFVSRHHAAIHLENGCYYLSDTSLGGVYINGCEMPLHNATERIVDGTRLRIGEYDIAVAVDENPVTDDFLFAPEPTLPESSAFIALDEPWPGLEEVGVNSLMADNFPLHEELVQATKDKRPAEFESRLQGNHSPLFDSYIAPNIIPPPPIVEEIPENFSFDDFFAETDDRATNPGLTPQTTNDPTAQNDFDDFFAAAVGDMDSENEPSAILANGTATEEKLGNIFDAVELLANKAPLIEPQQYVAINEPVTITLGGSVGTQNGLEISQSSGFFADSGTPNELPLDLIPNEPAVSSLSNESLTENTTTESAEESNLVFTEPPVFAGNNLLDTLPVSTTDPENSSAGLAWVADQVDESSLTKDGEESPAVLTTESVSAFSGNKPVPVPEANNVNRGVIENSRANEPDGRLFNAFLQGAAVESKAVAPEQQTETLHKIGQMFRKLVEGTVAVLRSRAEFKSLCRVNMTVIRSVDNNPLKFTVSTDDVLRRLLENKTEGFLEATVAIDEAFNDIMDHQLAMQAGIQASLTDLLASFDPKIIEKHFEQGIVLQKKAKCWDRYDQAYRTTVEDAIENFFSDEFVRAYDQQMNLLKKSRAKRQAG